MDNEPRLCCGRSVPPASPTLSTVSGVGRLDELDLRLQLDREEYEQRLEAAEKRLSELRLDFGVIETVIAAMEAGRP